jgi:hypothetical protein
LDREASRTSTTTTTTTLLFAHLGEAKDGKVPVFIMEHMRPETFTKLVDEISDLKFEPGGRT